MKNLKDVLESVLFGGLVFGICYLIGAFAAADFDISTWDSVMRGFTGFFAGILSFAAMGICYADKIDNL
jgi:hypothetical protein